MAKKKAAMKESPKKSPTIATTKRNSIPSEAMPRKTLEDALTIAALIRENYANSSASFEDIASARKTSVNNSTLKYLVWSAVAYGLIRSENGNYYLSETGRKILTPAYDEERQEGIQKALFTPSILSQFLSDYSNSPLPEQEMLCNVLERKYGIPTDRTKEVALLIRNNLLFANALVKDNNGKDLVCIGSNFIPTPNVVYAEPNDLSVENPFPIRSEEDGRPTPFVNSNYEKSCFIITPIGSEESQERKHADTMLKHLFGPILSDVNLTPVRSDQIPKPGIITKQVIEYLAYSRLCVADLSFGNPNVFYELGVRHVLKLPVIQIIRKGDIIPFDVAQGRTIVIDLSDTYTIMDRIASAKKEFAEQVQSVLTSSVLPDDNPFAMYLPKLHSTIGK